MIFPLSKRLLACPNSRLVPAPDALMTSALASPPILPAAQSLVLLAIAERAATRGLGDRTPNGLVNVQSRNFAWRLHPFPLPRVVCISLTQLRHQLKQPGGVGVPSPRPPLTGYPLGGLFDTPHADGRHHGEILTHHVVIGTVAAIERAAIRHKPLGFR